MEGAIRNLVRPGRKLLCCMNGAFSDKWFEVARANKIEAEQVRVDWGQAILPEMIKKKLRQGGFDAVTLIHNETSTGVMSPVAEIAQMMRDFPEALLIVDAVSSLSAVKIEMDALGLDVLLTGVQKALALPPGMSLFAVSRRAWERVPQVPHRGYYFDFMEFLGNHEKNMTPSTPSIGHVFALRSKLDDIFAEGLERRFARHRQMAETTRQWAMDRGFGLFPQKGRESFTLTCAANQRKVDVSAWIRRLRERHFCVIDGGYGKLKGTTFRIAHMGDETSETIRQLLQWLDDTLD